MHKTNVRRRGRPVAEEDVDRRERLLDAATELFAERGIAATPMSAIAARVGVTSAMPHYYFKTRERLLDVIVEERIGQFVDAVTEGIDAAHGDPFSMVRDLVDRIVRMVEKMPWIPPLWIKEIASDGGQLRERLIKRLPMDVHVRFAACVAAAQARGEVNPGLHPALLFVSIMGLTMFPLAVAKIWKRFPTMRGVSHEGVADHAAALLLHGLAGGVQGHDKRKKSYPAG